jgi:hypothetical protein
MRFLLPLNLARDTPLSLTCLVERPQPRGRGLERLVRLQGGPAAVGRGGDAQARQQGRRLRSATAKRFIEERRSLSRVSGSTTG